ELAFGADLARDARHLRREAPELVHHGIDRVLELENFSMHVHRDLLGEVAVRHRRRDVRDVAHLARQVACPAIHSPPHTRPTPTPPLSPYAPLFRPRACLRCRPPARRASPPPRSSGAGPPWY